MTPMGKPSKMTRSVEPNRSYRNLDDLCEVVTVLAIRDGIVTFQALGSHHSRKAHADSFLATYERLGPV